MLPRKIFFRGSTIFLSYAYHVLNTFKVTSKILGALPEGGHIMRGRRGRKSRGIGLLAITAGVVILMAMVLPVGFWWFALAVLLISLGFWYNHCR